MTLTRMAFVAFAFFCAPQVSAQEGGEALESFHDFFGAFVGGEWTYHTHMTGPDGKTVFEGEDVRVYTFGIRDRFLIGNVYSEEKPDNRTHIAVQLFGVDMKTGSISISQFWPWQSTLLGDVSANITEEDGIPTLRGTARPSGQTFPLIEFACRFLDAERYECISQTTSQEGHSFRSNVEMLTRRTD